MDCWVTVGHWIYNYMAETKFNVIMENWKLEQARKESFWLTVSIELVLSTHDCLSFCFLFILV